MKLTTWATNIPLDYANIIRISIIILWTTTKWLLLFQWCCARDILGIIKCNGVMRDLTATSLSNIIN